MMKSTKGFPIIPVIAFAALFAIGSWLAYRGQKGAETNPYQYDITPYKTVPEGSLKWHEEAPVQLSHDSIPQALVILADGRFLVGSDNGLRLYDSAGTSASTEFTESVYCLVASPAGGYYAGVKNGVAHLDAEFKTLNHTNLGEKCRLTSLTWYDGHLYAADFGQQLVWRVDANGTPCKQYAGPSDIFAVPSPYFDVAPGKDGLWIVDPGKHALYLVSDDFAPIKTIGKTGMGPDEFSGCCNPSHIAIQPDGSIVTLEKGLPRIRIFEADGALREFVTGAETLSSTMPATDLAVLADGRIAVLDPFEKQIRLFKRNEPGVLNGQ